MASDLKYGQIDVPGIPEDEPIFILRAKDKLALSTVVYYSNEARVRVGSETTPEFVKGVEDCVIAFDEWETNNPDKMKMPD
jgi:hypothetical protein